MVNNDERCFVDYLRKDTDEIASFLVINPIRLLVDEDLTWEENNIVELLAKYYRVLKLSE